MEFDTGDRPRADGAQDAREGVHALLADHAGYDEALGLGAAPAVSDPGCRRIAEVIDGFAAEDPHELIGGGATQADGDAATVARLRDYGILLDRLEAQRLRVLRAAEASGVLSRDGCGSASLWLRRSTNLTAAEAGRRARASRRVARLPVIAAALAEGRIGVAHASLIDRLAADVGVDDVAAIQEPLVVVAERLRDVKEFAVLCAGWRHALAPDALDERDTRNWERRRAGFAVSDGRGHLWGDFDAEASALIATAIDALTTFDGPDAPPDARRTREQRVADAITDMAARILDSGQAPTTGRQRPHVNLNIHAETVTGQTSGPPASLDWVGPVGRATALRILGDCSLTRIVWGQNAQPLDVGTATRTWPAGIRSVITARDGHCRFPGCDRPSTWCDIDHVVEVHDGGPTAVDNGILLCRAHHGMKQPNRWWPTLHPDGRVVWAHPRQPTRVTRPAAHVEDLIRALLDHPRQGVFGADGDDAAGDDTAGAEGHRCTANEHDRGADDDDDAGHPDDLAGDAPAAYHPHPSTSRPGSATRARDRPDTARHRRERAPNTPAHPGNGRRPQSRSP
jgi:hypothetical protein